MSRRLKIWLIAAASLMVVGGIVFAGVMTVFKWDFTRLSTKSLVTNTHTVTEAFTSISVNTDTAEVEFVPSNGDTCAVVCHEYEKELHSVKVADGTLKIELRDTRKWYDYIGINFGTSKITVQIPQGEYGALTVKTQTGSTTVPQDFRFESIKVTQSTGHIKCYASASGAVSLKTTTGHIRVRGITAGSMDISVSTGEIRVRSAAVDGDIKLKASTGDAELTDVTCKNMVSSGSTGDLSLENVVLSGSLRDKRSTGDVELDGFDAAELVITTDTGDVEGTLLSEKVFIVKTDTGDINVPKTVTGGRCEITTDTGDIEIRIKGK